MTQVVNNIQWDSYEQTVYSGGAENKLQIIFNNTYTVGDDNCEKLTLKARVLPENNNGIFSLSNFISREVTLILHDVNFNNLVGRVDITLSTKVNGIWEDVKLGVFNIGSIETTDKNKYTLKLRDNAVKFDFNYNAQPVVEGNGGSATLLQIFNDIMEKSGVGTSISSFDGDDLTFSIWDNTITARKYINYIAEQAGCWAVIDRNGYLQFIPVEPPFGNSDCVCIPLGIIEKYEIGDDFVISKVVYQDAIRDFEAGDDTANKLYINSANVYIDNQEQIDNIEDIIGDLQIQSVKTGKILGNPKIEPYNYVRVVDGNSPIFTTLANYTLTYNGVMIMTFDTDVKISKMEENISSKGEDTFRRWAKTNIEKNTNEISFQAGRIETLGGDVNAQGQAINSVEQRITETENRVTVISTNIDEETGQIQSVQNTIGTFDKNGLTIEKTGSNTKSLLDEAGFEIDDNLSGQNKMLLYSGYVNDDKIAKESSLADYKDKTVVYAKDLVVKEYITLPNGRFENVVDSEYGKGVGIFI